MTEVSWTGDAGGVVGVGATAVDAGVSIVAGVVGGGENEGVKVENDVAVVNTVDGPA
jgi:hypothetical protein